MLGMKYSLIIMSDIHSFFLLDVGMLPCQIEYFRYLLFLPLFGYNKKYAGPYAGRQEMIRLFF